jgi:hypothetical protein
MVTPAIALSWEHYTNMENLFWTSSLAILEPKIRELQRPAVFRDISDKLIRGVLRKLGLNVEGDLNIGSYDAGKMLDDLLRDA